MRNFRLLLLSLELSVSALVLFAIPDTLYAGTTPAFVQERDNQVTTGKTSGVTLTSPTTAGNLIVAYLIWDNVGSAAVSDSLGNVYASAGATTKWSSGNYSAEIFYAINVRSGANTVTATFSTAVKSFGIIYAHEYSGIRTTAPVDVSSSAVGSSGSLSSGPATTTNDVDLLFAGAVSANFLPSPGAGFTARSTAHGNMTEDRVVSAKGTYSATANNSSGAWGIQMVAFKGAATTPSTPSNSAAITKPYSTTFSLTENPISEGGSWINGKTTGLDWSNVQSTPGLAFGSAISTNTPYNDPTAVLAGSWSSNQKAQAVVHTVNQNSSIFEEVELRLRTTITAHSITGYEFNFRATADGTQYVQIVRWNGPFGNFTALDSRSGPGLHNGDTVSATAVGNVLTAYINGVQIVGITDNTFTDGSPGMGFYDQGGALANNRDFGFSSFTATDNLTSDTAAPSAPVNLAAIAVSSSQVNLSWNASTDNVGVVGYRVYRNGSLLTTTAVANYSDKAVVPGVQYAYTVTSYDAAGNTSQQSSPVVAETSPVSDVTPPTIPTNLKTSNVTSTTLTLVWTGSTDNVGVAGYSVFRNGAKVATSKTAGFTDTGLAASTSYTYTVAASDGSNNVSAQSQDVFVTTSTAAVTPPSFVQEKSGEIAAGTNVPVTFNSATKSGNTIVAYVIWNNAGSVVLSDSRGDNFASVSAPVSWGNGYCAQVFYASKIAGGTNTVTATFRTPVTSFGVLYVHEYSGISATNPVDATASASGSSTTMNSGTVKTTNANDLIFGAGVSDNSVTTTGSGFIARDLAYGNITEDRVAASLGGSVAATASHNGQKWGIQVVAFRPTQ